MIPEKEKLRTVFKDIRKNLSESRKKEAELTAFTVISKKTEAHQNILSFASLPLEINMWQINIHLSKKKNLYFPRVIDDHLDFFLVRDLQTDLTKSPSLQGKCFAISEPIIDKCPRLTNLSIITLALVPGLAFDKNKTRLGYGKGFYDKFLVKLKNCYTIGIGFKEQYYEKILPKEPTDIALDEILLF